MIAQREQRRLEEQRQLRLEALSEYGPLTREGELRRAELLAQHGEDLLAQDRVEEALPVLAYAALARPREAQLAALLGRAEQRAGFFAQARELLEPYARRDLLSPEGMTALAQALADTGQLDAARALSARVLFRKPQDASALAVMRDALHRAFPTQQTRTEAEAHALHLDLARHALHAELGEEPAPTDLRALLAARGPVIRHGCSD